MLIMTFNARNFNKFGQKFTSTIKKKKTLVIEIKF